jgi:hypothetical protein
MPSSLRHGWMSLTPVIAACALSLNAMSAVAQQPRSPQMAAPPPMRVVSREERSQLSAAKDPKARIRTSIDLAANRLTRVEDFTSQKEFDKASEELGGYLGLIGDVRAFCGEMNRDKGSTRDLYRHLDIALRAHIPRLAVVRRTTPAAYALNLKAAEEYVRETRAEALDSFYGHSVLREDSSSGDRKPEKSKEPPEGVKRP